MKKRTIIAVSIVALIAAGAASAVAWAYGVGQDASVETLVQSRLRDNRHFGRLVMAAVARRLDLTDTQKGQIHLIFTNERPVIELHLRQLMKDREALQAVAGHGPFDEAAVRAIAARQAQTLAELIVEKERIKSDVYGLLTPEQRAKADQMRQFVDARIRERLAELGFSNL
jgi:Spy/CpxP family protein refolding chaperone